MKIKGRRVLITGASKGIGEALARRVTAEGGRVALVARSADRIELLAEELGGDAYPADLGDLGSIPDLIDAITDDGPIDILVNNAAVENVGWFVDRTLDEIDQVITLNLLAPMHLCRLVLPAMLERGCGHIVNISSMAGVFAPPGLASYAASKAGLAHFTAGLRADLRDQPIDLTTVVLASVKTDMDDRAKAYGPLRELSEATNGRDPSAATMEDFLDAVIEGILKNKAEVRVPRLMAPLAMMAQAPRRLGSLFFRSVADHEERTDKPS
ncbi:MAG: SDR family NAD(P)-dependent oxidoreductase [Nitriliruptorales bacterium]|nr:SDR family NAD(P)-dependent oxidoreductase [Nitriliruptorales bacterium]